MSPPGFFGFEVGTSPELRVPMMREAGMPARLLPAMQQLFSVGRFADVAFARLGDDVTREEAQAATEVVLQRCLSRQPAERGLHVRVATGAVAAPAWPDSSARW